MRFMTFGAAALAAALAWGGTASAQPTATGPSFDCAKASSAVEKAVCADPSLAARDRTMARLYADTRTDVLGYGPSGEQAEQRDWEKTRDATCKKPGGSPTCLTDFYNSRLHDLAVSALFVDHDTAMGELTRQDPRTAPIYQAIYAQATIADAATRAQTVAGLIGPAFATVRTDDNVGVFLDKVADAHAAAASDAAFAAFIDAAGLGDYAVDLPCAAIVKRPGLIRALDGAFGSAMDNQLRGSDCDDMGPQTPHLSKLLGQATDERTARSDCDGSIRYLFLRNFAELEVAARLRRTDWASLPLGDDDKADEALAARFRKANAAAVAAASAELTALYGKAMPPAQASAASAKAMDVLVTHAFEVCN